MIIITFGKRNILKNTIYYYLLSIILGGSMYLLDLEIDYTSKNILYNYILLIGLCPGILYIFIKDNIKNKIMNMNKYLVEITLGKAYIKMYGYIDTGNSLKDPYFNRSIILIDYKIDIDKPILVPFKAVNTTGLINCFKPDQLLIDNKQYTNILIGISTESINLCGCHCILPNTLVEVEDCV